VLLDLLGQLADAVGEYFELRSMKSTGKQTRRKRSMCMSDRRGHMTAARWAHAPAVRSVWAPAQTSTATAGSRAQSSPPARTCGQSRPERPAWPSANLSTAARERLQRTSARRVTARRPQAAARTSTAGSDPRGMRRIGSSFCVIVVVSNALRKACTQMRVWTLCAKEGNGANKVERLWLALRFRTMPWYLSYRMEDTSDVVNRACQPSPPQPSRQDEM